MAASQDRATSVTDVFISYAREDRKFVQLLHDALANAGRESWVDWEGIPASAKWMAEVRAAIDEADCFCFVVSPDSVESPVSRRGDPRDYSVRLGATKRSLVAAGARGIGHLVQRVGRLV
jgi:hypothetical protein